MTIEDILADIIASSASMSDNKLNRRQRRRQQRPLQRPITQLPSTMPDPSQAVGIDASGYSPPGSLGPGVYPTNLFETNPGAVSGYADLSRFSGLHKSTQGNFRNPYERGTSQWRDTRGVKQDYMQGLRRFDRRNQRRRPQQQMGPWNTSGGGYEGGFGGFLDGYQPSTGGIWDPNPRWGGR